MRRKTRRLKTIQHEALALFEYLIAESYELGKELHYRFRVPYGNKAGKEVEYIIDVSLYFDGDVNEQREDGKKYKVASPNKKRH